VLNSTLTPRCPCGSRLHASAGVFGSSVVLPQNKFGLTPVAFTVLLWSMNTGNYSRSTLQAWSPPWAPQPPVIKPRSGVAIGGRGWGQIWTGSGDRSPQRGSEAEFRRGLRAKPEAEKHDINFALKPCRRKVRLSPKRRDNGEIRRLSHFSPTLWTGLPL